MSSPLGVTFLVLPVFSVLMFTLAFSGSLWARQQLRFIAPAVYAVVVLAVVLASAVLLGKEPRSDVIGGSAQLDLLPLLVMGVGLLLTPALYIGELWVSDRYIRWREHQDDASFPLRLAATVTAVRPMERTEAMQGVQQIAQTPFYFSVISVATAAGEEVLYRLFMLQLLQEHMSVAAAVCVQAFAYGLNHLPFGTPALVGKTCAGVVFGLLALASGGVLAPLVAHLALQYLVWRRARRTVVVT